MTLCLGHTNVTQVSTTLARAARKTAVSPRPQCPTCGRFMRLIVDAYTGEATGWRCVRVRYLGEGAWEHE